MSKIFVYVFVLLILVLSANGCYHALPGLERQHNERVQLQREQLELMRQENRRKSEGETIVTPLPAVRQPKAEPSGGLSERQSTGTFRERENE
jgi:hypothetical protein